MQATKVRTEQQGARLSSTGGAAKAPDFVYQRTIRIQAGAPSAAEPWNGEAAVDAANAEVPAAESTLSEGMRLGAYEVIDVIGRGGFGIVYLAFDKTLEQHVAVKEYMPASLASRVPLSPHVVPKVHCRNAFGAGLRSFINEARLLARFNHPALIKVLRFWEGNGTAYMAMPFYQGPTLARELADRGPSRDEGQVLQVMRPLLDGLAAIHAVNCFHRDVAPDNILLAQDGPLLLDFGAARRVIGNLTHDLSAVVKPGFSPIEQYAQDSSLAQGPWTDLYALAAVMYTAMTGKALQPSVDRVKDDRLEPLSVVAKGRFSARLLAAVDCALAIRPQDRPQNVAEFRRILGDEATVDLAATGTGDALRQATFQDLPVDFQPEPGSGAQAWIAAGLAPAVDPASARHAPQAPEAGQVGQGPPPASPSTASAGTAAAVTPAAFAVGHEPPAQLPASAPVEQVAPPASAPEASAAASMRAPPVESSGAITPLYASPANVASKPSWMRDGAASPRMLLYVLLGMSIVLVLGAIGFWLGSAKPPPMVSKLQPSSAATSTSIAITPKAAHALPSQAPAPVKAPPAPISFNPPATTPAHPSGAPITVTTAPLTVTRPEPGSKPERPARVATARSPGVSARCSEILQSASLGQLSAEESSFLKRECHR